MSSETSNGPEHAGRKITYFLGLQDSTRTRTVFDTMKSLVQKGGKKYTPYRGLFEIVLYKNADELQSGAQAFVKNSDKNHLIHVYDDDLVKHLRPTVVVCSNYSWSVAIGKEILPQPSKRSDRVTSAAKYIIAHFVKNIDEQLSKEQLPWGAKPYTLEQRRAARLVRQGKPIKVPYHPGRWNIHRQAWDDHYDCIPGTQVV
jgi:hypothetical protein